MRVSLSFVLYAFIRRFKVLKACCQMPRRQLSEPLISYPSPGWQSESDLAEVQATVYITI